MRALHLFSFLVITGIISIIPVQISAQLRAVLNGTSDFQNHQIQLQYTETESLTPPLYLAAHLQGNDVLLSWGAGGSDGNWLTYDNSIPSSSLGLAQPGTFRIAARWPASSLTNYVNNALTRFAFIPNGSLTNYTLKIWKDASAVTLVHTQPLNGLQIGQWNEVLINSPFTIEPNTEYWFGFEMDQLTDYEFPATFDTGPAIVAFGDMVNLGGSWIPVSNYGFNGNWILKVFAQDEENPEMEIVLGESEILLPVAGHHLVGNPDQAFAGLQFPEQLNTEVLLGYNLYRNGLKINTLPVNDATFSDPNVASGAYTYGVTAVYDAGESTAVEKIVQVGNSELGIAPAYLSYTLQGGQVITEPILLTNAGISQLDWNVGALPLFFSLSSTSGSIAPGSIQSVQLTINTSGIVNGANSFVIQFNTNNLNNPVTNLVVSILIDGQVLLSWNPAALDFGPVPIPQTKLLAASMTNLTDATIFLYSYTTSTANFTVYPQTWAITSGETLIVPISFTASDEGVFADTLEVEYFGYMGSGFLRLPLSGEGAIMPPSNLSANLDDNTVTLNWFPPGTSPGVLQVGNGEPFGIIGTSGPSTFEFAHRYTAVDLMPYYGKKLDQIGFYIGSTNANFVMKVYTDENGQVPIISLPVSNLTANAWNDIALPVSVALDQEDYLWIGYEIDLQDLEFIAGVDAGPAIPGSGDLLKIGATDWTTLTNSGLSYNWSIRGLLSNDNGDAIVLSGNVAALPENFSLLGYNVYRDGTLLTAALLNETSYSDPVIPGESHLYGVTAVYDYGESQPAEIIVASPASLVMPSGWNFTPTSMVHNFQIPENVLQIGMDLIPGDMVGVFYDDNGVDKCAGAALWNGDQMVLTAYGNNPATPQKDGFNTNEPIKWKVFMSQTGITTPVITTYNQSMPHNDGTFNMMGLSMLDAMEMGSVGVIEATDFSARVFPNPSSGNVNIRGISSGNMVAVYDLNGRILFETRAEQQSLQFTIEKAGLYIVEIRGENKVVREKLIIK